MLDAVCIIIAGYCAKYVVMYYVPDVAWRMDEIFFLSSILVVMFVNNYMMGRFGMYGDRKLSKFLEIVLPTTKSVIVCFALLASIVFFFRSLDYPRSFLILFGGFSLGLMVCVKYLTLFFTEVILSKGFNARNVLIVGNKKRGEIVKEILDSQVSWGHNIIGRINLSSEDDSQNPYWTFENLPGLIQNEAIDEVFFAIDGDRRVDLSYHLEFCKKVGVAVKILPALWDPNWHRWSIDRLQGVPFFSMRTTNFNANGILYKRIMDLIGGTIGSLIFLLIYPVIAIAIKQDSLGPVLFKQKRVGLNGRVFSIFKFRTMYMDAEERKKELMEQNEMDGLMFKMADDPRITKVGNFLRKTSLDEFPQFFNVLKGEMSLVGTRPPTLDEVGEYEPWHLRRISGKPGLTGLWQISGRNKITDFNEVVKLDCRYLDQWRFMDDIIILLKTISVVMKRKGAV